MRNNNFKTKKYQIAEFLKKKYFFSSFMIFFMSCIKKIVYLCIIFLLS